MAVVAIHDHVVAGFTPEAVVDDLTKTLEPYPVTVERSGPRALTLISGNTPQWTYFVATVGAVVAVIGVGSGLYGLTALGLLSLFFLALNRTQTCTIVASDNHEAAVLNASGNAPQVVVEVLRKRVGLA